LISDQLSDRIRMLAACRFGVRLPYLEIKRAQQDDERIRRKL